MSQELLSLLHTVNPYDGFAPPYPLDLQGWHGTAPIFAELIEKKKPKLVIEVGTWMGQSAATMGQELRKYGGKLICVDTWLGSTEFWLDLGNESRYRALKLQNGYPQVYYRFLSNMAHLRLQDTVIPFPQTSANAARVLAKKGVEAGLIYIDASHEEGDVLMDLQGYWPLLEDGGMMFGDDWTGWPGLKSDVQAFADKMGLAVAVSEDQQFWMIQG